MPTPLRMPAANDDNLSSAPRTDSVSSELRGKKRQHQNRNSPSKRKTSFQASKKKEPNFLSVDHRSSKSNVINILAMMKIKKCFVAFNISDSVLEFVVINGRTIVYHNVRVITGPMDHLFTWQRRLAD